MKLQDSLIIEAPVDAVWAFILDIPRVSACVPGAEGVNQTEPDAYRGKLKAKVGAVKAAFEGEAKIEEKISPQKLSASFKAQDRALASIVTGAFSVQLTPIADGTQLDYQMDITMRGRLATMGFAVVQQSAKKMTAEFAACLSAALAEPPPPV